MTMADPIRLRGVEARNRVLFGPHETNLGTGRAPSDRHVAYYRRRAAGGAGVIVTETASVHALDWPYERAPLAAGCADGWARIARACHEQGALVFASLGHAGGQGSSAYSQRELWAPSPVPEVTTHEVPKAMQEDDIAEVVEGFAAAARVAVGAGLDGVEVNAGQWSLVRQFLSGLTNQRGDGYGADRPRFAREVLAAVREAAGGAASDIVVGLRLCCDEMAPWAGIVPDDAPAIAGRLAADVDYVVAVRGSIYTTWATRPDGHTPPGFARPLAAGLRAALPQDVRVVAQGSIVDVAMAEEILAAGEADLVEMTRAQIADPSLAEKAAHGQAERVLPCTLCNQACMVRDVRNPIVSCIGDPSAGHETEDPPVPTGHIPAPVLVVGGGPAGLEAARVAALAGHDVRLVEAAPYLGGMLRVAAAGPGRERLALLTDWLEAECRRLGVTIETGTTADVDALRAHGGPTILCTGSRPGRRTYEVAGGSEVRTSAEVLAGPAALPDGPVAVWDPIGGPIGISLAEQLTASGRDVVIVTPDLVVGSQLGRSGDLAPASTRLQQAGVELAKRSVLRRVTPRGPLVTDAFTGEEREIKAALVVDAGHRLSEDTLWRAAHTPPDVRHAGDCVAPRTAYEAVLEGRRAVAAQISRAAS
ncbi:MAG: mycofactocin system FadH/OYE family oxidoreductase 1 [Streptosporangiaceae bacterium]